MLYGIFFDGDCLGYTTSKEAAIKKILEETLGENDVKLYFDDTITLYTIAKMEEIKEDE